MIEPLPPGACVGILGGGQLGRMLALAGARLGFDMHVYTPDTDSPAARVAASATVADWHDAPALRGLAQACDVITLEFENVPVATVDALQEFGAEVRPGARSLTVAQDRLVEKETLRALGLQTAAFHPVDTAAELREALAALGEPAILKTRRHGYDGKGQVRIAPGDDAAAAWAQCGGHPAIVEAMVGFACEISVLVTRTAGGDTLCYDPPRNEHAGGVLRRSTVPSGVAPALQDEACRAAEAVAGALGHLGVMAVEFFVLPDGSLLANEIAPRVHNSGHWTPEACLTGQFEQHIRAIAGWPLGPVTRLMDAWMDNLLGEEALIEAAGHPPGASLTLYGKRTARPERKMGHRVSLAPLSPARRG